jgi:cell wall assembly regulator SMI1
MQQQLDLLTQQLRTQRPGLFAKLNPPLTVEYIHALEENYNVSIPEPVQQLYRWRNGQAPNFMEAFVNNSMFIPLEEALNIAIENTGMIGYDFEIENWWNKDWLPLFHNGGGDYICYDAGGLFTHQPGQLIEFWHADNDRDVIAPDLLSFLTALNNFYATANPGEEEEYFQIAPPEGYPKKFTVG